jgi:hypothetical protein
MATWQKLWETIDGIQSISDSRAQWMKRLGECWSIAMPFMALQPKLSDYLPHPTREGHWLRVVEHSTEDVVGIDDQTGEVLAVSRINRSVYRIDSTRLAPMVTRLLDIKHTRVEETDIPFCSRIGTFQPLAGFAFPVYLCLIAAPIWRAPTTRELGQRERNPFVLFIPSHRSVSTKHMELLRQTRSLLIPMDIGLQQVSTSTLALSIIGQDLLDAFLEEHLPTREIGGATSFFPTPSDAQWAELKLRFLDGETVSASVRDLSQRIHYTQLGMANSRNAKPSKQWSLLEAYARNRGRITWTTAGSAANVKKQTQLLAERLQSHFRIAGKPIEFDKKTNGYYTTFQIEADN